LIKRFIRSGQRQSMLELFRHILSIGGDNQAVLAELENQLKRLT